MLILKHFPEDVLHYNENNVIHAYVKSIPVTIALAFNMCWKLQFQRQYEKKMTE